MSVRRLWRGLAAILLLTAIWASPAMAESTVRIAATRLASLPDDGSTPVLVTVRGRPVVMQGRQAWIGSGGVTGWRRLPVSGFPDNIVATASDGTRTVLADGRGIATLDLARGAMILRLLAHWPEALTEPQLALDHDTLLVAGIAGGSAGLYRLAPAGGGWQRLAAWPGGGAPAALAAQDGGVFVTLANGRQWRWFAGKGWRAGAAAPGAIVAGSARAIGQAYVLYLVRDARGTALYSYGAITDAWARLGTLPGTAPVAVAPFDSGMVALARSDGTLAPVAFTLATARQSLALVDWAIIVAYLLAMLAIGFRFYRATKRGPANEFFLGSRQIPFWAAGISMFAGSISSISYLAVPAKAFETDWQYIMSKITTVCGLVFVAIWVVPLFRRLNLVSVFNYLETRFHPAIRMLSSSLWILMQIGGRMGIVLYLPAMAIGTITDTSITLCIVGVGLFTIVYTALGGMKAVVWTDVFQVIVLTGGALFAIGYILVQLGLGSVVHTAAAFDKTHLVNTSFDVTQPTIWAFLVLVLFDVVLTFPKDQVLMQRVLATTSEKQASRSVWLFAAVLLPSAFMFYIIGTVLFAYYRAHPDRLSPLLPIDAVFPSFIGTELPHGVVGVIIAGLIAAAMGTLSGIINSVATLLSVDFYDRLVPGRSQRQIVRFAEISSVVVGLVGIAIALVLSRLDIHSLLDLTIELFGLLGGACAGAYTLGLFTRRANWQGVAIGIVLASVLTSVVWWYGLIHPYLYLALAIAASIGIGYVASLFFPPPAQSLDGLTIFTGRAKAARREEPAPSTSPS